MKINWINCCLALGIAALVSLLFWGLAGSPLKTMIAVGTFVFLSSTLCMMIGVRYLRERTGVNLRVLCSAFLAVGLVLNGYASIIGVSPVNYLVVNGIGLLVYIIIFRMIYSTAQ
jgi:hypothetical protein